MANKIKQKRRLVLRINTDKLPCPCLCCKGGFYPHIINSYAAFRDIVVGYRNQELFLAEELAKYAAVHIATDDGSAGIKGTVMEAIAAPPCDKNPPYSILTSNKL